MSDDSAYFYERAERQLALAEKSDVPAAVKAHSFIANRYLDRAYGEKAVIAPPEDVEAG